MNNCFTYVYKTLQNAGFNVPTKWEDFDNKNMKLFIARQDWFLEHKLHFKFFESFCSYVEVADKYDVIIDDHGVGIALNKFKYISIKDKNNKIAISNITKDKKIMRVK